MKTIALLILLSAGAMGQDNLPLPPARPTKSPQTTLTSTASSMMRCTSVRDTEEFAKYLDSTLRAGRLEFACLFLSEWDDYLSLHHMREWAAGGKKLPMDFEEFMQRFARHLRRELK